MVMMMMMISVWLNCSLFCQIYLASETFIAAKDNTVTDGFNVLSSSRRTNNVRNA